MKRRNRCFCTMHGGGAWCGGALRGTRSGASPRRLFQTSNTAHLPSLSDETHFPWIQTWKRRLTQLVDSTMNKRSRRSVRSDYKPWKPRRFFGISTQPGEEATFPVTVGLGQVAPPPLGNTTQTQPSQGHLGGIRPSPSIEPPQVAQYLSTPSPCYNNESHKYSTQASNNSDLQTDVYRTGSILQPVPETGPVAPASSEDTPAISSEPTQSQTSSPSSADHRDDLFYGLDLAPPIQRAIARRPVAMHDPAVLELTNNMRTTPFQPE
ncbi:hypothetical protein N658DRAFT_311140 [Parathielavia hyrcaniae]|uniref:Uncharacterized protein n=1 Tax=Parathielavia hyrcaniae TaxID=113614 RepID=A0AAN6T347_9PEZI|nr:hypothetical protein N658DRAFT_311140 [Parathielavia hyrcaniae]